MPELEERQAKIEGILEQVEKRITRVETEITDLRREIADLRRELVDLKRELNANFRWLVMIAVITWAVVILGVVGLYYIA